MSEISTKAISALLALVATGVILLAAGCNLNKYDAYDSCDLSDGRYQIVVSVAHDSSEPKETSAPATYAKLCRELVGGPGVHIERPAP